MKTTGGIRPDIWKKLNARKEPGDSFSDVLKRELGHEVPISTREFITIELEDDVKDDLDELAREGQSLNDTISELLE